MSNSDNPKKGAEFQKQVRHWFQEHYGTGFELETKIPIGDPAKDHKYLRQLKSHVSKEKLADELR